MATTVESNANPTTTPAPAATPWYRDWQRLATTGVIGVAVIAAVIYFVVASSKRKQDFAAKALTHAEMAADAGNLPQASTELQKVIATYKGTESASEAVLVLNQIRLRLDQAELAATNLREFLAGNPEPRYAAEASALLGAALENAKRWSEAGDAYMQAAEKASQDYLKATYLVDTGRAYRTGGMTDKAVRAYRTVVERYRKAPNLVEAQLRLAELTSGKEGNLPAKK
jgi:tetratricopeptide (TPR) repeat protein